MLIILFILLIACVSSAKFAKPDEFHKDYLSKEITTAVNGIFVILVFLRHFTQYVKFSESPIDRLFLEFNTNLGQLLVTTFLFYSGYGIMCSIRAKGDSYVNTIPKKRMATVWLHFAVAVALFLIVDIIIGKKFDIKTILLAFIGWSSIGNSNWYIFAVLFLYLFVFIAFKICKKHSGWGIGVTLALTLLWVWVMIKSGRPQYTFNTVICYPLGMLYALFKSQFEKFVMKNDIIYSTVLAVAFISMLLMYQFRNRGFWAHSLWSVIFITLVLLITMKVRFCNGFLTFLGSHVFGIYILQRIPMLILTHFGFNQNPYMFLVLSFLITVPMTLIFDFLMKKLDIKLRLA